MRCMYFKEIQNLKEEMEGRNREREQWLKVGSVRRCRFPQRERRQGVEEKSKGHLTQAFDLVRSSRKVPFL